MSDTLVVPPKTGPVVELDLLLTVIATSIRSIKSDAHFIILAKDLKEAQRGARDLAGRLLDLANCLQPLAGEMVGKDESTSNDVIRDLRRERRSGARSGAGVSQ